MPKGKSVLAQKSKETENTNPRVEMKEVEQRTSATSGSERRHGKNDVEANAENTSAPSSPKSKTDKGKHESPPGKPHRVFVLAGSINKRDAKPVAKHSGKTPQPNATNSDKKIDNKTKDNKTDDNNKSKPSKIGQEEKKRKESAPESKTVTRTDFGDDDHPYEDPNLVVNVNNSATLLKPVDKASVNEVELPKRSPKMKEKQRSHSPEIKKSQESIKAAKKHPSVMAEHSIARSVFAVLVALLLSLIVFLSLFFLVHCHPVLSVVLAILMFLLILLVLGFLHLERIKCLLLLFVPSVLSNGGKIALYVLLLYFVIKGPLCNTIGNIRSVQNSITCINNQGSTKTIQQTLQNTQKCIDTVYSLNHSTENELYCLMDTCNSSKQKLLKNCVSKNPKLSQKTCDFVNNLSCNKSNQSGSSTVCSITNQSHCQKEFEAMLAILGQEDDDSYCDFMGIIGMLLPLLILLVFLQAYNYQKNYQTFNGFQNYFLTGHFQCIDQSRTSCDRNAVLPLRKVELRNHIRPATVCQLTEGEKKTICSSLKVFLVVLLIVVFLILADLYVYRIFDTEPTVKKSVYMKTPVLVNNPSDILPTVATNFTNLSTIVNNTRKQSNVSNNSFTKVNSTQMSNLTATGDGSLYLSKNIGTSHDKVCRVWVEAPGEISKVVLPTLLVLTLLAIFLQVYVIRLQWYICSRFYKEREKERVFYLYNRILEDRIQLVENCRNRMQCYHREMDTLNFLEPTRVIAQQSIWMSKLLKFFHINLRKCVICNDAERASFKICHGPDCSGVYCLTCSFDIDKKCLYCDTKLKRSLSKRQPVEKDISSKESLV